MSRSFTELAQEAYETATEKGFDLHDHVAQLLLVASEVAEALDCFCVPVLDGSSLLNVLDRFQRSMKELDFERSLPDYEKTPAKPLIGEGLGEELADIVIRVMSYATARGIDLETVIVDKMSRNKDRPWKHGKSF